MRFTRLITLCLLIIPALLLVSCDKEPPPRSMLALTEDERRQKFKEDLNLVNRYDAGLERTLAYARGRPDLFPKTEDVQLTAKQKRELRRIWQTILDYMRGLDAIKAYWKDFHKFGAIRERRAHTEAFMVGYSAWLTQYKHGLEFVDLTVPSKPMEKLLDEKAPRFDIPAGSFAALKWNVIHVKAVTRYLGSHQYWKTVVPSLSDYDCDRKKWCDTGLKRIEDYHEASKARLKERAAIEFSYNAFDIARDMSFDAWFPVQKGVAVWMGDTKVRRLHDNLITEEQLEAMAQKMEPGDLIVTRHNWYLSNVGLPGFWPHAELYVAPVDAMSEYFSDPKVTEYVKTELGAESLPKYLETTYPKAWEAYTTESETGPPAIIEAISEGVVFSSLQKGAGADYVGVMRPKRSKVAKARALIRAFELWGRPYDFNFDFTTDETLVCSELVYKAWRAAENERLGLPTSKVMGRVTLPPSDIVKQFDETCDDPDGPLEFVYFLDGREKGDKALVGTKEQFRKTWKRPKWDTMQK